MSQQRSGSRRIADALVCDCGHRRSVHWGFNHRVRERIRPRRSLCGQAAWSLSSCRSCRSCAPCHPCSTSWRTAPCCIPRRRVQWTSVLGVSRSSLPLLFFRSCFISYRVLEHCSTSFRRRATGFCTSSYSRRSSPHISPTAPAISQQKRPSLASWSYW